MTKIKRTLLIKLRNGNIEKVDDGETHHYEYAGKPFDTLDDFERQEIREDPIWSETVEAMHNLVEAMKPILIEFAKTIQAATAQISASIVEYQRDLERKKAAEEAKKKKLTAKKPAKKKAK